MYYTLDGFALDEIRQDRLETLWLRGGFPKSFLASSNRSSAEWRRGFIRTFLERDIPSFGITISAEILRRFWTMLAHYHGQTWNASEFARSFGVADTTVGRYLDSLASTFVVGSLKPWHANLRKRQVKAPKVYIADSGLLHALLNIITMGDLEVHSKIGASWEGFMLGQVIQRLEAASDECFFWATQTGAELDLLVVRGRQKYGFEFKRTEAPKVTRSMQNALKDLGLNASMSCMPGREHSTWQQRSGRWRPLGCSKISGRCAEGDLPPPELKVVRSYRAGRTRIL